MAGGHGAGAGEAGAAGDRRLTRRRPPASPTRACRRAGLVLLAALLAALFPAAPLAGQQPDDPDGGTSDAAADRREAPLLRDADLVPAGVLVGSLLLVPPIRGAEEGLRREVTPGDGLDGALADAGDVAGDGRVALGLSTAAWALGAATGSEGMARVGRRSAGSLATAAVLELTLKAAVGRSRPTVSAESDVFRPLSFERERHAFPSAHAAHAFALATTLDRELDAGWVPWAAYPAAGLVAASRVAGREHWPTDVVAGAAVGVLAGRLAGRALDRLSPGARPAAAVERGRLWLGVSLAVGGPVRGPPRP